MPFYRYKCVHCETVYKVLQQKGNGSSVVCPECGSREAGRLLPRIGVIYRGNGYYSTDYARKGKNGRATAAAKAEE
jgi:putative FmdB family regulatory protein